MVACGGINFCFIPGSSLTQLWCGHRWPCVVHCMCASTCFTSDAVLDVLSKTDDVLGSDIERDGKVTMFDSKIGCRRLLVVYDFVQSIAARRGAQNARCHCGGGLLIRRYYGI